MERPSLADIPFSCSAQCMLEALEVVAITVRMFRQSGHQDIMVARGPRFDGFRCGIELNLDLRIRINSFKVVRKDS